MNKPRSVLVVFNGSVTSSFVDNYDEVILERELEKYTEVESIYEANSFLQELSQLTLSNNTPITKLFLHKDYELWWIHYQNLFQHFCLPYTRYKRLLNYLLKFERVHLYNPSNKNLFLCYLQAYSIDVKIINSSDSSVSRTLPFGVFIQICLTTIFLLLIVFIRPKVILFTGDKFDEGKDYDFRLKFIYEQLRSKNIHFIEFIRSLEPWRKVIQHSFIRNRPVIYSEAVTFFGRFINLILNGTRRAKKKIDNFSLDSDLDPEKRFRLSIATIYLQTVYEDIWSIRIMQFILCISGVRVAIIPAAMERNFHTVIACKINSIPIIGILHGASSKDYNVYDFMRGFVGEKSLSVDKYGVWSKWWKEYYEKYSDAYKPEQLHVSGPIRPKEVIVNGGGVHNPIKVLFVPGELSCPEEILPYIDKLRSQKDIHFYLTFRPYRDRFESWLKKNNPSLIDKIGKENILRGNIHNAIARVDVVVGAYSTAVLEATLYDKPFIFFNTRKWGDYFELKSYDSNQNFFAQDPNELTKKIKNVVSVSKDIIDDLRERYFGNPTKNGSEWVVQEIEKILNKPSI